jgi:N-acetylneuraminate synthase
MTRGEYNNRVALGKSLTTKQALNAGDEISRENLTAKSPAKGISPQELYSIIGKQTQRDVEADEPLHWNDLKDTDVGEFDIDLDNWGIVVRFSDVDADHWGDPDVFEFRINGADLEQQFDIGTYDQELSIHAPEQKGHNVVDLSARDETIRQNAVETIQRVVNTVREDVKPSFPTTEPSIVIHPGGITEHEMDLESIPEMNDALQRTMAEIDDDGVQLLLENMPPLPWIYGGQQYHNNFMAADEIAEYCERTGQKICYDTSHAKLWCNYADVDLFEHAKTLRPYTEYLHIADAVGVDGEGIQIGEGEINWDRIMTVFDDFDGPIITEIWRGHERRGAGFKKAAQQLSQYRR